MSTDETPAELVQRQLDAYNAQDIDAFLATYHPDVEIFNHPGQPTLRGHAGLRDHYVKMWSDRPNNYAALHQRIELGRRIIDHEIVYRDGQEQGPPFVAIAVFEVEDGLIRRVDFLLKLD